MPKLLTTRKAAWVKQRKPQSVKGTPLNPNAAIEARYYAEMAKLIDRMTAETSRKIMALFKREPAQEYFAQDISVASQARVLTNALKDKFYQIFNLASRPMAERMTDEEDDSSAASLKASLKQLSGGLTLRTDLLTGDLKQVLNATITENVGLIRSIATQYLDGVQGAVMRSITTGNGLADLVPYLKNHDGITLRRARIIARDQTRKAFSNINSERMKKIGITEYEWLHSAGGQKPRKLHVAMSGKIYSLEKPPVIDQKTGQRGKPGDLINCRCRMVPVIRFDED